MCFCIQYFACKHKTEINFTVIIIIVSLLVFQFRQFLTLQFLSQHYHCAAKCISDLDTTLEQVRRFLGNFYHFSSKKCFQRSSHNQITPCTKKACQTKSLIQSVFLMNLGCVSYIFHIGLCSVGLIRVLYNNRNFIIFR